MTAQPRAEASTTLKTELQAAEQRLKDIIRDHAPTPHIGTMVWCAAHAYAKAMQHAERDRLLASLQEPS